MGNVKKKKIIRETIFCKKNLERDIAIILFTVAAAALIVTNHCKYLNEQKQYIQKIQPKTETDVKQETIKEKEAENPIVDTADWKIYKTQWYGFEIKYPNRWKDPIFKSAFKGSKWEYQYQFRKLEADENTAFSGFDVIVYNIEKIKEFSNTDEFPKIKNEELKNNDNCRGMESYLTKNEKYTVEQIYVSPDDSCYNLTYFYTITRGDYIYNIVPVLKNQKEENVRTIKEITYDFPEFVSAAASFSLIEIERPKPVVSRLKPAAPKSKPTSAPMPIWYKEIGGKRVCAKKNDHPGKSDKNKKKHLDMECCLDPDEYPNPHCYYPKDKYGKYL